MDAHRLSRAPKPLRLRLLGELQVISGGRELELPASRKTRALLAYLVVTGAPQRREWLCDLLWDGPDDPRAELRWSLAKIRPLLDDVGSVRLRADRARITFLPCNAEVDLVTARTTLTDLPNASLEALKEALALFRGTFLEGLDLPACYRFQEWCLAEREKVAGMRVAALKVLTERLHACPAEALIHARDWLAADPLSEEAHAKVVELLGRLGRRQEAVAQYQQARRVLAREHAAPLAGTLERARSAIRSSGEVWVAGKALAAELQHLPDIVTDGCSRAQADLAEPAPDPAAAQPHAERRHLTVLVAHLVDSTALSSRLDPEDMREFLHRYQDVVTAAIGRIGGHVARRTGDGVLAYFGWPQAYENEAECAVRAGLAIVEAVAGLASPEGEPLKAQVGIASGLVVVGGLVGEAGALGEPAVGQTPLLAARLQEVAPPGSVVIAPATRQLVGDMFELRDVGPIRSNGFPSLTGFQVLGERASESRFEVLRIGRSLPMVGRDQELALLLERWRQALAGEGQAVLLVGEPGIGKSRLLQAALDAAAGDDTVLLRFQCSPHHTGTALWPLVRQLALAADIGASDADEERLRRLETLLLRSGADLKSAVPLIAPLLSFDAGPDYPLSNLTPVQQRARTLAVLVKHLLGLARGGPLLFAMEDVHWIDPTSLEFIEQLLHRITGARALMLLTCRPDNQPTLGGHPHVMRLTLNRLGRAPSEAIVMRLTGDNGLPPDLLAEIATRTEGIPLFIEELTKAVLEAGKSGAGTVVPASLHASLMARLDRVVGVKEVAQRAACIGREFAYPLLAAVSPIPETELQAALDRLAVTELIFRRGVPPEASYVFKHALVRDAAHESLLKAQRREVHAAIARELEDCFPEVAEAEPEVLAQHYTEAGITDQAVDYSYRAGRQALARSAVTEAIGHLNKGLELLQELPSGAERRRRELGLQVALGQSSIAAKGFAATETGRAYGRAHELCRELGEIHELYPVLYGLSVFHFQHGELDEAHELAQELLRLGRERNDPAAQITGYRMIGSALSQFGRFAESRDNFLAALALYDPERDRNSAIVYAIDSRVMCSAWLSHLMLILGYPDHAISRDREVPVYVRELAHANTAAVALAWGGIFAQLLGDQRLALTRAQAAIELAIEQGFPLYRATGTIIRGWALAADGQAEDGIDEIRRGLAEYAATGAAMWSPYFLTLLAQAEGWAGREAAGLNTLANAMHQIKRMDLRWIEAETFRMQGELLLAQPNTDPDAAEMCFHRALTVAKEQDAALWELRAATSLARHWVGTGNRRAAREVLRPIADRFSDALRTRDLREAQTLLRELG